MITVNKYKYMFMLLLILISFSEAKAQTQLEINEEACKEYNSKDKELNKVYQQILTMYKTDTVFINKLKVAQRAWITFRDAHLEALYPAANKQVEYGSFYPSCSCNELAAITQQRIKELKRWLDGVEEGDPCSGSIRNKE